MSLRRLRSVAASAWTHRGIAMLAVVIGGGQVGAALRRLADPSPDFGLVAQTYLAGWLWRAGVPLTALYDPTTLRAAQAQLQPDGPVLAAPWLQPPSLALLGIPLTPFTLPGAYSVFS
ncbi:MAG: hypothetical protein KC729_12865, partial [Candidatus Eisenbacteria bacterium]|nr:hypothetical protein [Candidatus Eisenbacteria bacterium]